MRVHVFALAVVASLVPALYAQAPTAAPRSDPPTASEALPVRRVVLYKTGIGYFEHRGRVRDDQDVTVRFTTAQLNDVLKSLTAVDLGQGRVGGITYTTNTPPERRAGALALPLAAGATLPDLLKALRGARVQVSTGGAPVQGRLLAIEDRTVQRGSETVTMPLLSLVTGSGELRTFELTPALQVRVVDRDLRQEIAAALDVAGAARERDVRRLTIHTRGTGSRELFVSYVSEVPVWKTTYRLVLPDRAAPFLQGWAIVDNTVGEDWHEVQLSLVAGAPQTFVQEISQPYYTRRPVVPLPQAMLLWPQTHQSAMTTDAGTQPEALAERVEVHSRAGYGGGTQGGIVGGMVGGLPSAPPAPVRPPSAAQLRTAPAATAAELGDLFEYRIDAPVTIARNGSALVPILDAPVGVEKVSLWNHGLPSGRPLRAVWLTNSTDLTLDGGTLSVVEGDAFAGEALVEPLAPGQHRLVSYATDHAVRVHAAQEPTAHRLLKLSARDGFVTEEMQQWNAWKYTLRNDDRSARTIVIEHPAREGWTLTQGPKPDESTPTAHRFRVRVDPGQHLVLEVTESHTVYSGVHLAELGDSHMSLWTMQGMSASALERALGPALEARRTVSTAEQEVQALTDEQDAIVRDQERVRENMKALRGSSEERQLLARYATRLQQQEERLGALAGALRAATERRDRAQRVLANLLATFSFDPIAP